MSEYRWWYGEVVVWRSGGMEKWWLVASMKPKCSKVYLRYL